MSFGIAYPGLGGSLARAWLAAASQDDADMVSTFVISEAVTQPEGNSGTTNFTFTIARTGALSAGGQVQWAVTGTGANPANAADFAGAALPSGTQVFAPGQASATISVQVAGDTATEPNEQFQVTLSNARNDALIGVPGSAVGTIANDDGAAPDFSIVWTGNPTGWGAATALATLVPSNAPAGAYFVLVGEPAGLAVVNG